MKVKVQISINASKESIWHVITNIENSTDTISGIEKIELLEQPADGIIGLKWRETRIMFGKTATEVMWITDAVENEFYQTRAESHGSIYISRLSISEGDGENRLTMEFKGEPQSFGAKLMYAITGFMFKGATQKALLQDLQDIKVAVEKQNNSE